MNAQQLAPIVMENKEKLDKLLQWKNGNGAKGAEARLQELEKQEREMSCRSGQRLDKHIGFHREQEGDEVTEDRWLKEMRVSRRNNLIGFIGIAITVALAIIFGG